ncbi:MAG: tetratricopeptide repeat protein [Oscillospiraceae bacterium]|nr:tetratricopeptide repeat protein [Oscillospiraceae bacterium]
MKKLGFLIPILLFLGFSTVVPHLFAAGGGANKGTLILIIAVFCFMAFSFRPKQKASAPVRDVEESVRGEFAKDAFVDDTQLNAKFLSALSDYSKKMPKSALNKLNKLSAQCRNDQETYAVAMATALVSMQQQNYKEAIRQYNKAIVLHPSVKLAMEIGSCYQRQGELKKARDSYEFALDLDSSCLEARSRIATTFVADGDYDAALEQSMLVLEQEETNASALATAAICYGLLKDPILSKRYTQLAVDNGYSEKKITETISALKKR